MEFKDALRTRLGVMQVSGWAQPGGGMNVRQKWWWLMCEEVQLVVVVHWFEKNMAGCHARGEVSISSQDDAPRLPSAQRQTVPDHAVRPVQLP